VANWFGPQYGWAYVLCAPVAFVLIIKLVRLSEGGRYVVDLLKLKIPILGAILSKTAIARFTRTLGTLISAGVPILDALNITKETCGNEVYSKALMKVHDAIREGESMADPLRSTKVCDAIVVNMVDVGEETGDLDKMLVKIADNYDNDVDVLVGSLISILEPVMVVVLGCIVGFIVVALFMPMVALIQSVSGGSNKK
jgi:type IV pilus assembly protein PilC